MKNKHLTITEKTERLSGKITRTGKILLACILTFGGIFALRKIIQAIDAYRFSKDIKKREEQTPQNVNTDYKYVVLNDEKDEEEA